MASNLSTIGFTFASDGDYVAAMTDLAAQAIERLSTSTGEYAIWRSRTGAELWFHLAPASSDQSGEREIIGLTPFFEGRVESEVEITDIVRRDDDNALEGAFQGWMQPDDAGIGAYPVVFDVVDFAAQATIELPKRTRLRLTGFAREVRAFPTVEDFRQSAAGATGLAIPAFIPLGLLREHEAGDAAEGHPTPSSHALLTGRVTDAGTLTNEVTGAAFQAFVVESLATSYDIVADPDVVNGTVSVGTIVEVSCWLVGRLVD